MASPPNNLLSLDKVDEFLKPVLQPESLLPKDLIGGLRQAVDASNRILFAPRQNSLGEAITADIYDVVIGFVPFIGDAVANGTRTAIATNQGDNEAAFFHGADLVAGIIPVYGDLIDALIPANTILYARQASKCVTSGGKTLDCLFPENSIERKVLKRVYGRT